MRCEEEVDQVVAERLGRVHRKRREEEQRAEVEPAHSAARAPIENRIRSDSTSATIASSIVIAVSANCTSSIG